MIPMIDMCNHPSITGVRRAGAVAERFQEGFFSSAAWRARRHPREGAGQKDLQWADAAKEDEGLGAFTVTLSAPTHGLKAGEELLLWYGDAGWGAPTAEEREAGELDFIASFGFSPWS